MKSVEVKDQIRPTLKRCAELVLSGIRYRLFRAAITVAIIALAAAFLMTMLSESMITRRVSDAIDAETAPRRQLQSWVARLADVPDPMRLNETLATLVPGGETWQDFAGWSGLSEPELFNLTGIAQREAAYLDFFANLSEGKLRPLVGRARSEDIFSAILERRADGIRPVNKDRLAAFAEELARSGERFPSSVEEFSAFLTDWARTAPLRERITRGHAAALATLRAPGGLLDGRQPREVLAIADGATLRALTANGVGFHVSADELDQVKREAALALDAERIERTLSSPKFKSQFAARVGEKITDITSQLLFSEIESGGGAAWFVALTDKSSGLSAPPAKPEQFAQAAELGAKIAAGQTPPDGTDPALLRDARRLVALAQSPMLREELAANKLAAAPVSAEFVLKEIATKEGGEWLAAQIASVTPMEPLGLTPARVREVARSQLRQGRLAQTETLTSQTTSHGGFLGYSSRTLWLLGVSFLVCVVGIANAMLMSVTERFREIATIKCLGATDGFIMISFVMESCMQGVAGSAVGLVLGLLLGMLRSWVGYGWMALENMPALALASAGMVSVVLGIGISALAAVYPAWVAARLAPMEAMRIE